VFFENYLFYYLKNSNFFKNKASIFSKFEITLYFIPQTGANFKTPMSFYAYFEKITRITYTICFIFQNATHFNLPF